MKNNIYRHTGKIKKGLIVLALIIVISTLLYTQNIVNQLRRESRELVEFYANIFVKATTQYEAEDFGFIFNEIVRQVSIPMIVSSQKHSKPKDWKGLDIDDTTSSVDTTEIEDIMYDMDKVNDPIPIKYQNENLEEEVTLGYIHYGDTKLIKRLQLLPYIEIFLIGMFILLGYGGLYLIRNSEKQSIWAGMARETAHQLGTPISSLMGWQKVIESELDNKEYAEEMNKDIKRLEKISNRFSKIGSEPDLTNHPIKPIIKEVIEYYRKRLPQLGEQVDLCYEVDNDIQTPISRDLLSWAIENVIKNSIDASEGEDSFVKVKASEQEDDVIIDIIDNGKGIPKKDWKNIFRPGFSSKRRGWGLGLSLTRRIIADYHNGKVFVKSSQPGNETIIRIII